MSTDTEFEFYRELEGFDRRKRQEPRDNVIQIQNEYTDAWNKSSSENAVPTSKENIVLSKVKKILIFCAAIVVIAVSSWAGISLSNAIEDRQEELLVAEYFEEQGINRVLSDASWGYTGRDGQRVYGYNQNTIVDYVNESDNPDLTLYGFYQAMSTERTSNMDAIVSRLTPREGETACESEADYFAKRGFVDKDGNPSREVYEEVMTKRALAEVYREQAHEKHGVSK